MCPDTTEWISLKLRIINAFELSPPNPNSTVAFRRLCSSWHRGFVQQPSHSRGGRIRGGRSSAGGVYSCNSSAAVTAATSATHTATCCVAWLGGSVEALKLAVGDADAGAALVGEAVGDTVVGETVLGEVVGDSVGETVGDSVVGDRVGVHVSPASVGVRVLGEALGETVVGETVVGDTVGETVVGDTVGETVLGEAVVGGTVGVPVINGANSRVYLAESNDPHCSHKPPTQG
jgi:hypothetical protein